MNKVKFISEEGIKMQSSRKLIKPDDVTSSDIKIRKIETIMPQKKASVMSDDCLNGHQSSARLKQYEHDFFKDREKMLEELQIERQNLQQLFQKELEKEKTQFRQKLAEERSRMLTDVQQEIEDLKQSAEQKGFEKGEAAGFKHGQALGFQQGKDESQVLVDEAHKLHLQVEKEIFSYQQDKKGELVDLACQMAETVINKELALSEKQIYTLLEPFLKQLEKKDNFVTVFVSKEMYQVTLQALEELKTESNDFSYSVIADSTLERYDCLIETDFDVLNLTISDQLNRMKADLLAEGVD